MAKSLSLLKIQKLAGCDGVHLYSQLLRRLRQENCLNPDGAAEGDPVSKKKKNRALSSWKEKGWFWGGILTIGTSWKENVPGLELSLHVHEPQGQK